MTRSEDILQEIEDLDKQIERAEKLAEALKATAAPVSFAAGSGESNERAKIQKRFSITEGVKGAMQKQVEGLAAEMDAEARRKPLNVAWPCVAISTFLHGWPTVNAHRVWCGRRRRQHPHNRFRCVQVQQSDIAMSLQSKSVLANAGVTQLSGFAGDVDLPVMPGNGAVLSGGNATDDTEADALTPGTTAFSKKTLKPTRCAAAVDVSKNLMYSVNGKFGRLVWP